MTRTSGLAIAALAITLTAASLAEAARSPTRSERAAIVKTVNDATWAIAIPRDDIAVTKIRVSTVRLPDRLYARVIVYDKRKAHPDTALGVVRRLRGHWRLLTVGTSSVGCRTVPARVRADLKLTDCP